MCDPCLRLYNLLAFNYDSLATVNDGSCIAVVSGCMNPIALNYFSAANVDDGSCIIAVPGCTNPSAFNYNFEANVNDGFLYCYNRGLYNSRIIEL